MSALRVITDQLWRLFLASQASIGALVLLVVVAGLVRLAGLPPTIGGAVLLAGCVVILAFAIGRGTTRPIRTP